MTGLLNAKSSEIALSLSLSLSLSLFAMALVVYLGHVVFFPIRYVAVLFFFKSTFWERCLKLPIEESLQKKKWRPSIVARVFFFFFGNNRNLGGLRIHIMCDVTLPAGVTNRGNTGKV